MAVQQRIEKQGPESTRPATGRLFSEADAQWHRSWAQKWTPVLEQIKGAVEKGWITEKTAGYLRRMAEQGPCNPKYLPPEAVKAILRIAEPNQKPNFLDSLGIFGNSKGDRAQRIESAVLTGQFERLAKEAVPGEMMMLRGQLHRVGPTVPPNQQVACGTIGKFRNPEIAFLINKWSSLATKAVGVKVDPNVIAAMYGLETTYGHDVTTSEAGAKGLLQMMPDTRAQTERHHRGLLGQQVRGGETEKQVAVGVLYFAEKIAWARRVKTEEASNPRIRGISVEGLAAMAYNWGQGNMEDYLAGKGDPLPSETLKYRNRIEAVVRARQIR